MIACNLRVVEVKKERCFIPVPKSVTDGKNRTITICNSRGLGAELD
jgi:hypothetical protein